MKRDVRIALISCRSILGNLEQNILVTEKWTDSAAAAGAELICFPELNITGYPSGGCASLFAETIPGPSTRRVENLSSRYGVTILAGIAQTDDTGTFVTHVVIGPEGLLGIYQKIHLGPSEKTRFIGGRQIPVFCIPGFKFGIQLCYDAHFPELATAMAVKGVDAILIPHASPKTSATDLPDIKFKSWSRHLTARAYDNSVFIAAVNPVGDNGHGLDFPGVAMLVDPSGNICKKYRGKDESMLILDLKKSAMDHVRNHRMRYFLPNRRPDIYEL